MGGQLFGGVGGIRIEKKAGLAIADEFLQATDTAGDDCSASAPCFKHDDAERFVARREHEGIRRMIGIDEQAAFIAQPGNDGDGFCEMILGDEGAEFVAVGRLGFRADHHEFRFRSLGLESGEGFEQAELVFLGIDAADVYDEKRIAWDAELFAKAAAIAGDEPLAIHTVGEIADAVMGQGGLGLLGLAIADTDHVIRVFENLARAEQCSEGSAPFDFAFDRFC